MTRSLHGRVVVFGSLPVLLLYTVPAIAQAPLPPPPPPGYSPAPPPGYAPAPPPGYAPAPPPGYAPAPPPGYAPAPPPGYAPAPPGYAPYPQYAPYPPPPAPPAPPPKEEAKPGWDLDAEMLGLRGSTLGAKGGGDPSARTYGVGVATMGISNYAGSILTYRGVGRSLLGGGSGGFEGELGGALAVGIGFLVDEGRQGPFLRVGVQGYILGNDSFFQSNIQFPQGSVGWHLGSRDGFLLEGGFVTGPMLDGRFNVGSEGHRRLGSSGAFGAYVDAFIGPLTGTVQWMRTDAVSQPDTAVDGIDGQVCLSTGRAKKESGLGLCFDGRYTHGDVHYGVPVQESSATATYLGVTIGFGFAQSKPK